MSIQKIAVLGAGNGGCAAAADLTLRGYEVRLFSRSESTIARLAKRGEIELIEDGVKKSAAPHFMSPHLPAVVQGADLIVVVAPAVAHEYLARNLASHLTDGQRVLLNPGHTWRAFNSDQWEADYRARVPEQPEAVRARLDDVRTVTHEWLEAATPEQLATFGNHPERGVTTVADRIEKIARHEREHTGQLARMREAAQLLEGATRSLPDRKRE